MKRTAFDEARDQRIAEDTLSAVLPCSVCKTLTDRGEMSDFGARCFPCYRVYCRGCSEPMWPLTHADKAKILEGLKSAHLKMKSQFKSPKAWADTLQLLEKSGGKLTLYQRSALRSARPEFSESKK